MRRKAKKIWIGQGDKLNVSKLSWDNQLQNFKSNYSDLKVVLELLSLLLLVLELLLETIIRN